VEGRGGGGGGAHGDGLHGSFKRLSLRFDADNAPFSIRNQGFGVLPSHRLVLLGNLFAAVQNEIQYGCVGDGDSGGLQQLLGNVTHENGQLVSSSSFISDIVFSKINCHKLQKSIKILSLGSDQGQNGIRNWYCRHRAFEKGGDKDMFAKWRVTVDHFSANKKSFINFRKKL
jgi:hypothetical protein